MGKLHVVKTEQFHLDLEQLADHNFPRRPGRVAGTMEMVAHPNYIVLLQQTETTVTVFNLLHVARQYP
jgi:hypothetical protein